MLTFQTLTPKEFFNPMYFKNKIQEDEFADFIKCLKTYDKNLKSNAAQNEDSILANALAPFLQSLGFSPHIKYKQQGKSEIDLALLKDNQVAVIIEAKKQESKEMFSEKNLNAKALHEAILYYFREREGKNSEKKKNPHIKHIIITDFTKFYIFKSVLFEKLFYENKAISAQCQSLLDSTNELISNQEKLYKELKNVLDSMSGSLECFCIDLQTLQFDDYKSLKPIFKALHRDFLLDEFNPNDANILNERFYLELLYILGLCEEKQKDKILIKPSKESQNGANTLYKCIIDKLPEGQRDFDFAMGFVILWLNRILFLKLIEANLVRFNNGDKNLKFLNLTKIPNFKTLSYLFFEILSKKPDDAQRGKDSNLCFLPYLNSSLFDKHDCEKVLEISAISDEASLAYFPQTQIKDKNSKTKSGSVGLLAYMFEFLDSFDFGSDEEEGELAHQKELISSSVLGLVFEKLNGYKEGSFFTPSFITSYMCRVSLEKVILQKFSEIGLNAPNLEVLKSQILMNVNADFDFRQKALGTLQSIKICDPAVGSGHFLVSALCEMIGIYRKLGLADDMLNACEIAVNNDEVHISQNGKNFTYQKPNANNQNHKIQVALFELKKSIIENNLFGVDINPNSVEICKLRLWIELLKNSYYLTQGDEGFYQI